MHSYSNGPVTTLPGHVSIPLTDIPCDLHPDVLAVMRVQTETDSLGCEYSHMCTDCYTSYRESLKTRDRSGVCDLCGSETMCIIRKRDPEEGMSGRVYSTCPGCALDLNSNFDN